MNKVSCSSLLSGLMLSVLLCSSFASASTTTMSSATTKTIPIWWGPDTPCGEYIRTGVLPTRFDWRNVTGRNFMTDVKDQGDFCGSCWAFGTVAAVEGSYKVQNWDPRLYIDLSEQDLVSCYSNTGCGGLRWGQFPDLWNWIASNGISSESCFPYAGAQVACVQCPAQNKTRVNSFGQVHIYDFNDTKPLKVALLCNGPVVSFWGISHVVSIAGWDDNNSNCMSQLGRPGCFIYKDSYGVSNNRSSVDGYGYFMYFQGDYLSNPIYYVNVNSKTPENCCNNIDDNLNGGTDAGDDDCIQAANVNLSAGTNSVCWSTPDPYPNNFATTSGNYTCPSGYNASVNAYVDLGLNYSLEIWGSARLSNTTGHPGNITLGPYASSRISFHMLHTAYGGTTGHGVKIWSITCSNRSGTTTSTSSTSTTLSRTEGDADGDGHVNYSDLIILAASYGKQSGEAEYDSRADFNGDGSVDYDDLIVLAANYGA